MSVDAFDILKEDVISLQQAADTFPVNVRPTHSTIWRWVRHGRQGVKLQSVRIGTFHYTSRQAVNRFLVQTQDAK